MSIEITEAMVREAEPGITEAVGGWVTPEEVRAILAAVLPTIEEQVRKIQKEAYHEGVTTVSRATAYNDWREALRIAEEKNPYLDPKVEK